MKSGLFYAYFCSASFGLCFARFFVSGGEAEQLHIDVSLADGCQLKLDDASALIDFGKINKNTFRGDRKYGLFYVGCKGSAVIIELDSGQNFDKSAESRRMALGDGVNFIPYSVFQGTSISAKWGEGKNAYHIIGNAEIENRFNIYLPKSSFTPFLA